MTMSSSLDIYNSYVVLFCDMPANGDELIQAAEAKANSTGCFTIVYRLSGTGAGLVDTLQRRNYLVRGWVDEKKSTGYLELYKAIRGEVAVLSLKTARIGVVAVVADGVEFYVVEERYGPEGFQFPTGFVASGETPHDAVVRVLREQTGITESKSNLLAVHYATNALFHIDDCYFVFVVEVTRDTEFVLQKRGAKITNAKKIGTLPILESADVTA